MPRKKNEPEVKMQLMSRDCQFLSCLYHLRVLSTTQITRLFFPSGTTARRRLVMLTEAGYLTRENYSTKFNNQDFRYFLTKKGIDLVIHYAIESPFGPNGERLYYTAARNHIDPTQQMHQLMINEIFVEMVSRKSFNLDESSEMPILDLLNETWLETRRAIVNIKGNQIKPDARFTIGDTVFWIELDRGTESVAKQKFKRYYAIREHNYEKNKKHVILFFCLNYNLNERAYSVRISSIRKAIIERLHTQIDGNNLEVYADDYSVLQETLNQYLVPLNRGEWESSVDTFADELSQTINNAKNVKKEPQILKHIDMLPSYVLSFEHDSKTNYRMIEDMRYRPLSVYVKLRKYLIYIHEFKAIHKQNAYGLIIADTLDDLIEINKMYPSLRSICYFTTSEQWNKSKAFYGYDHNNLAGEGVI